MPPENKVKHQSLAFKLTPMLAEEQPEGGQEYGYFEGYGAVFNNIDHSGDMILPGAFADSLMRKNSCTMLWQHWSSDVIGKFTELREDMNGLYVKGRINLGVERGAEAYALIKAGDLDGLSIGYSVLESEWDDMQAKGTRLLKKVELYEISLVTWPCNEKATVTGVKSVEGASSLAEVEALLRGNGFSRDASRLLVTRIKALTKDEAREAPSEDETQKAEREAKAKALRVAAFELRSLTHNLRMTANV